MADEIQVEITFSESEAFPASLVVALVSRVDQLVNEIELAELEAAFSKFKEISPVERDAACYRITHYPAGALQIQASRAGSLILLCAAMPLALWVLDKTLGETLKEAWVKSSLHHRLLKFLSARRGKKAHLIARQIQKLTRRREKGTDTTIEAKVARRQKEIVVVIHVRFAAGKLPTTTSRGVRGRRAWTRGEPPTLQRDLSKVPEPNEAGIRRSDLPVGIDDPNNAGWG